MASPAPLYRVVTPALLSEIHIGLVPRAEIPQGLTRCGSWCSAIPGMSETRSVSRNEPRAIPALALTVGRLIITPVARVTSTLKSLRRCMLTSLRLIGGPKGRSEEHTSELQSPCNLV